jgi:hypothetical protein
MYQMDCKLVPYGEEERRCVKCGYITWNNEKTDKEIIDDMIAAGYPVPNCREKTTKCECGANTSCQCGPEEPKQETLEEVRKVERTELFNSILSITKQIPRKDVDGDAMDAPSCAYEIEQLFYKWQQEQDNLKQKHTQALYSNCQKVLEEKIKQDKNKFSEEDMINRTQVVFELTNKGYSIDEIIEQFKKK